MGLFPVIRPVPINLRTDNNPRVRKGILSQKREFSFAKELNSLLMLGKLILLELK